MKRVIRIAVSGKYSCVVAKVEARGRIRNRPPFWWSSRAPKMLGESNLGAQNQSTEPSEATSAAVCRSPIRPWSAIRG